MDPNTFMLYFSAVGMIVSALLLLASVAGIFYVLLCRGKGSRRQSHRADSAPSGANRS